MASSGGFKPSPLPPIAATGMRGFLKWYAREQPNDYPRVAKALWGNAPEVFSDYVQSRTQAIRGAVGRQSLARRTFAPAFAGLGQDDGTASDLSTQIATLSESDLTPVNLATSDDLLNIAAPNNIPSTDAANAGAGTTTATTNWISQLITGATGLFATQQQGQLAQTIVNAQLSRAQQGLSPLNIGWSANGLPTISASGALTSSTGLLLIGGLALVAVMMMRGGSKR